MAKTETIRARVKPELKEEAEQIFDTLGLSPTDAITLFYKQVTLHHGLPFDLKVPNAETRAAIADAETGHDVTRHASAADLIAESDDA